MPITACSSLGGLHLLRGTPPRSIKLEPALERILNFPLRGLVTCVFWSDSRKSSPDRYEGEVWSFTAPYFLLTTEKVPQCDHSLREVFNALYWIVRAGSPWQLLPNDFTPRETIFHQGRCWLEVDCPEAMVVDLHSMIPFASGRQGQYGIHGQSHLAVELAEQPAQWLQRLQTQAP